MFPRLYVWKKVVKHNHVMVTCVGQRLNLKHFKSKSQCVHVGESRRGQVRFENKWLHLYRLPLIGLKYCLPFTLQAV